MIAGDANPSVRFRPVSRPAWLPESAWPLDTFAVEANGSTLAVTEAGTGPALLLVHVGTWSFLWRDLVTRLSCDFRCIFFDAPGSGQTSDNSAYPHTMEDAARAVTTVIGALDLRDFTLVAHDLGGPASIAALAGVPERVRGIVAMNAFAWKPSGAALRSMLAIMGSGFVRELDVLTGFLPRIASSPFGIGLHMDEASRAVFRAGMDRRGRRSFHNYIRDARRCNLLYARVGRALAGPLAQVPMLTIFGERNDPFGFQKRWKDLFPDARQAVVAKGNHFPMCDAPDFVAREIREWYQSRLAGRY